jgi:hypothetical protein
MIWLVFSLVVAFALAESLLIERLWRDQRRTRGELDELFDQVDTLAIAVDRQILTQEQLHNQVKPVVAAVRESNKVVAETMDALVGTVREAKAERRKLRDLIAHASAAVTPLESSSGSTQDDFDRSAAALETEPQNPAPISWPGANGRMDITAAIRREGRPTDVAVAERPGRTLPAKKRATG